MSGDGSGLFSPDLIRGLVVTKRDEFRVAEVIVASPFKKFDLCHQNRLQPATVLHFGRRETGAPAPALGFRQLANGHSLSPSLGTS